MTTAENEVYIRLIVAFGYQPSSKTPPPLSCQAPPLNLQTVQDPPFLGNPPLYIGFL